MGRGSVSLNTLTLCHMTAAEEQLHHRAADECLFTAAVYANKARFAVRRMHQARARAEKEKLGRKKMTATVKAIRGMGNAQHSAARATGGRSRKKQRDRRTHHTQFCSHREMTAASRVMVQHHCNLAATRTRKPPQRLALDFGPDSRHGDRTAGPVMTAKAARAQLAARGRDSYSRTTKFSTGTQGLSLIHI